MANTVKGGASGTGYGGGAGGASLFSVCSRSASAWTEKEGIQNVSNGEFTAKPLVTPILRTMTHDPGKLERLEGKKNVHT